NRSSGKRSSPWVRPISRRDPSSGKLSPSSPSRPTSTSRAIPVAAADSASGTGGTWAGPGPISGPGAAGVYAAPGPPSEPEEGAYAARGTCSGAGANSAPGAPCDAEDGPYPAPGLPYDPSGDPAGGPYAASGPRSSRPGSTNGGVGALACTSGGGAAGRARPGTGVVRSSSCTTGGRKTGGPWTNWVRPVRAAGPGASASAGVGHSISRYESPPSSAGSSSS